MPPKLLSQNEIEQLVNTCHHHTGIAYPPPGLQPYYCWLINTIHRLANCCSSDFLVTRSDLNSTSVYIAPGRACIAGQTIVYGGEDIELSQYNNSTVYIYLQNSGVAACSSNDGWPESGHLKLAELSIEAANIINITDRRFEAVFNL